MPKLSKRLQQSYEELSRYLRTFPSTRELQNRLAAELGEVLSVDALALLHTDPVTFLATSAFTVGMDDQARRVFSHRTYLRNERVSFLDMRSSKQTVALLSEYTRGNLESEGRYLDIYKPRGLRYEIRACLNTGDDAYWGGLCIMRGDDNRDFTGGEQTYLAMLAPRLAEALRVDRLRQSIAGDGADQVVTLLLDRHGRILFRSRQADGVLDRFSGDESNRLDGLPWALAAVVSFLQTGPTGAEGAPPQMTVQDRLGAWWTILALPPEDQPDGPVASMVVISPARPEERFPRLMAAFDLTARERELVELIAAGLSTKEIAGRLYLSEYTVMDHLKKIFGKMNINSRRELMALLYHEGTRIP